MIHISVLLILVVHAIAQDETQFTYNGFQGATNKLHVDGIATILPNGLLQLTNYSSYNTSHAFYPRPVIFKPNHISFSTTFIFAIYPIAPNQSSHGIVFVISPTTHFQQALPSAYLGLFNTSSNRLPSNHIIAVELDTIQNPEFKDIDSNHVGIDVNSLTSSAAATAAYYSDKLRVNKTLQLNSGKPMQIWIDYDEVEMLLNVTLAPFSSPKPSKCLLSKQLNLSTILLRNMYVGFSSATGPIPNYHYILGWSWNQSGKAQDLDPSKLPSLPQIKHHKKSLSQLIIVLLIVISLLLLSMIAAAIWFVWKKKYEELLEPWEKEYAPYRYSFKELYLATKGFKNSELLGVGGFGKVYKGIIPSTSRQVAVKRVSQDSKQGIKEFVAEISSMGRLRHRNLVQLLGYCRRKGELLLVYDYMPNGSLDKLLFDKVEGSILCWSIRFKIIKGVASALLYLHEEWEQVVLHRDVKASNVLLDAEMNARLGDFGLAKLYDHSIDPRTTHVVGTIGYIAPELSRTRKPTTSTDVFSYGMFLLEVGCGRRPIGKQNEDNDAEALFLSDWVYDCWKMGDILKASDPRMEGDYVEDEMELILKLGLLCLYPIAEGRPTMRQVVQILNGSATLPELPSEYNPETIGFLGEDLGTLHSLPSSFLSSSGTSSVAVMSSTNSVLRYGR
ncbi:L-type lectin-domain containing receptor kinase IV.2-like [Chenopodium quinoa]|uniref:non-specific serine/threonine protein kinase n=1 Tax=Chenopodium quinoa TaxID=63459 RepID=A0A803LX39_CHEQI|nr:L-type lectin-domain containing receptor kinase IV.2-like [Chenopodium quinoa]